MPGPTETDSFERAGMEGTKLGYKPDEDDAAEGAREGFEALMADKDHVNAGSFINKVQATMAHELPDTAVAEMRRKQAEPRSGNK